MLVQHAIATTIPIYAESFSIDVLSASIESTIEAHGWRVTYLPNEYVVAIDA